MRSLVVIATVLVAASAANANLVGNTYLSTRGGSCNSCHSGATAPTVTL
jgi:hypothetical protein